MRLMSKRLLLRRRPSELLGRLLLLLRLHQPLRAQPLCIASVFHLTHQNPGLRRL
jgi:hypothetical protein